MVRVRRTPVKPRKQVAAAGGEEEEQQQQMAELTANHDEAFLQEFVARGEELFKHCHKSSGIDDRQQNAINAIRLFSFLNRFLGDVISRYSEMSRNFVKVNVDEIVKSVRVGCIPPGLAAHKQLAELNARTEQINEKRERMLRSKEEQLQLSIEMLQNSATDCRRLLTQCLITEMDRRDRGELEFNKVVRAFSEALSRVEEPLQEGISLLFADAGEAHVSMDRSFLQASSEMSNLARAIQYVGRALDRNTGGGGDAADVMSPSRTISARSRATSGAAGQ